MCRLWHTGTAAPLRQVPGDADSPPMETRTGSGVVSPCGPIPRISTWCVPDGGTRTVKVVLALPPCHRPPSTRHQNRTGRSSLQASLTSTSSWPCRPPVAGPSSP